MVTAADRRKVMLLAASLLGGLMLAATARAAAPAVAGAPTHPSVLAETPRRIGASVGLLVPEADTYFDTTAFLDLHWSSFNLSESLILDTHLTFVSYEDDDNDPNTDMSIDSSLFIGLMARHHHNLESLGIEYYFQVGAGYMINTADNAEEVDSGIVIPIGVGINYQVVPRRITIGLEYTSWITEAALVYGTGSNRIQAELDASMFAVTVSLDF